MFIRKNEFQKSGGMKQHRTDIINSRVRRNGYETYLEIGLGNGDNFKSIRVSNKTGVDPNPPFKADNIIPLPSDDFFDQNDKTFDLIFIDGLHHSDQVERDIVNSYNCLNTDGMILIHDVNPPNAIAAQVPRTSVTWTGDVYRAVFGFIDKYNGLIKMGYYPERVGVFAIMKNQEIESIETGFNYPDMQFAEFVERRSEMFRMSLSKMTAKKR